MILTAPVVSTILVKSTSFSVVTNAHDYSLKRTAARIIPRMCPRRKRAAIRQDQCRSFRGRADKSVPHWSSRRTCGCKPVRVVSRSGLCLSPGSVTYSFGRSRCGRARITALDRVAVRTVLSRRQRKDHFNGNSLRATLPAVRSISGICPSRRPESETVRMPEVLDVSDIDRRGKKTR